MESLSDIERDLRDRADCAERHGDRETHNDGVATLLRSIADRIEAIDSADAWRSLYTPGNAAAMREAIVWMSERMNAAVHDGSLDCYEALRKIEAALSAPARNCDRFADELEAQLAFLNEVWLISVDRETMLERDKYENWTDEMRTRYGRWLLAPAAERKGEGK